MRSTISEPGGGCEGRGVSASSLLLPSSLSSSSRLDLLPLILRSGLDCRKEELRVPLGLDLVLDLRLLGGEMEGSWEETSALISTSWDMRASKAWEKRGGNSSSEE